MLCGSEWSVSMKYVRIILNSICEFGVVLSNYACMAASDSQQADGKPRRRRCCNFARANAPEQNVPCVIANQLLYQLRHSLMRSSFDSRLN
jgi:hypothetical protein